MPQQKKEIVINLGPLVNGGRKAWETLVTKLTTENLWKRIIKCVIATTITVIIVVLPGVREAFGAAAYLATVASVFGHPGRRLGAMAEVLLLGGMGALCGIAWSSLGLYTSGLVRYTNYEAWAAIRAVFLIFALFFHGLLRSIYPRLFFFALLFIIVNTVGMTSPLPTFQVGYVTQFVYPIFTSIGVMFLVNVTVFPEFGSSHLGDTTIQSLQSALIALRGASNLFVLGEGCQNVLEPALPTTIEDLTELKAGLRQGVDKCKSVYQECTFELAYSVIGPKELKPIAVKNMRKMVENIIALIGACESRFALLKPEDPSTDATPTEAATSPSKEASSDDLLEMLRPRKEIESGSGQLLMQLLKRIHDPLMDFQVVVERAIDIITVCVAYAYDVDNIPVPKGIDAKKKTVKPRGITLEELDIYVEWFDEAINEFSKRSLDALERAAILDDMEVDIMPRDEVFLISSFLLNLQQAARYAHDMLVEARHLVELGVGRHERRRLHWPIIKFRKWLQSGNEEGDGAVYTKEDRDRARWTELSSTDSDSEAEKFKKAFLNKKEPLGARIRQRIANVVDWARESSDFMFSAKLTCGATLLCWPAFVSYEWNQWYYGMSAVWCPIVYIVVFQDVVGSTVWVFFLRTVGTVAGAAWGLAAYSAGDGNKFVIVVMLFCAFFVSFFVLLGTQYQKAGVVLTISMCLVSLGSYLQPDRGGPQDNFYKRSATMLIGGTAALLVHTFVFPVKSRHIVVNSLAEALHHLICMESCIATGIDQRHTILSSEALHRKFDKAAKKGEAMLKRADINLGFVETEPRIKGDFSPQIAIYREIIFVLRQVAERLQNLLHLRQTYGNIVLEEFTTKIYLYRRNVAAAITVTLYAINEALLTKSPLPQFLPSARLAHLRMVIRVRQLLMEDASKAAVKKMKEEAAASPDAPSLRPLSTPNLLRNSDTLHPTPIPSAYSSTSQLSTRAAAPSTTAAKATETAARALRLKVLSWNASAAALEECIEYIEELIDLTKTLFGAFEFRTGLLNRKTYRGHITEIQRDRTKVDVEVVGGVEAGTTEVGSDKTEWGSGKEKEEAAKGPGLASSDIAPVVKRPELGSAKGSVASEKEKEKPEKPKEEAGNESALKKVESATGSVVKKVASATGARPTRGRSGSEVTMPVLERMRSRRQQARIELKRANSIAEKREEGR